MLLAQDFRPAPAKLTGLQSGPKGWESKTHNTVSITYKKTGTKAGLVKGISGQ
jgi:hypothetical protein